jgi:uncharacterized protein
MVLPFINRDNELAYLNQKYARKRTALIVICGRRRIGKTTLIKEFIKGKTADPDLHRNCWHTKKKTPD